MMKTIPNLMTGSLWLVNENKDGAKPISLKEFRNNREEGKPLAALTRGNLISKDEKVEQHIIFEGTSSEWPSTRSFRIFLYENGTVEGRVIFPIDENEPHGKIIGNYKLESRAKITIWGVWAEGADYKERHLIYIEF